MKKAGEVIPRTTLLGAFVFIWVLLAPNPAAAQEQMPDIIFGPKDFQGVPVLYWVSAGRAATPDGDLDWKLMNRSDEDRLRRYIRSYDAARANREPSKASETLLPRTSAAAGGDAECLMSLNGEAGIVPPDHLDRAVDQALAVLSGKVVAASPGFSLWLPGVLLKVRVQNVLKRTEGTFDSPELFVFYPKASFTVGRTRFCGGVCCFPLAPLVGDTVLILPPFRPHDPDGVFVEAYRDRFFLDFSPRHGLARVPSETHTIVPDGVTDLAGLTAAIQSLLDRSGAPVSE